MNLCINEKDVRVRLELASGMIRLSNKNTTCPLLHALMQHKEDAADPVIPLMLWYAYEKELAKLVSGKTPVANAPGSPLPIVEELQWLAKNAPGNPLITDHIISRAMRRLTATGKTEDLAACVTFVEKLKQDDILLQALEGLVEGLKFRPQEPPANWESVYPQLAKHSSPRIRQLTEQVAISLKNTRAIGRAVATLKDTNSSRADRLHAVQVLTPLKPPEALFPLIDLIQMEKDEELRRAAATALGAYNAPVIAERLLPIWKSFPDSVRVELVNGFKSHQNSARLLLDAVGKGTVPRTDLTDNTILAIRAFNNRGLNEQIERVWGRYRPTPQELEKLIAAMHAQVKEKPGDAAKGKLVFQKNCLQCHKFDNQGHDVGPALDGADRSVHYILVNVLDPNRVIGQPYYQKVVLLKNGQLKTGLLHGEDDSTLTLKREQAALEVIQKKEIDNEKTVEKSLMPEGLDKNITPEEFRHLVEYLRRK
jgi:putative heme-binding domain-containing protein